MYDVMSCRVGRSIVELNPEELQEVLRCGLAQHRKPD
jgi:hypothetical protein